MNWREELGDQIRKARKAAGLSQLQLAEMTYVKREHISNIELGKNSPAVKIITDIAKALGTSFRLDGCVIDPGSGTAVPYRPIPASEQMRFDFGVEYRFVARSILFKARDNDEVEVRAVLSHKRSA